MVTRWFARDPTQYLANRKRFITNLRRPPTHPVGATTDLTAVPPVPCGPYHQPNPPTSNTPSTPSPPEKTAQTCLTPLPSPEFSGVATQRSASAQRAPSRGSGAGNVAHDEVVGGFACRKIIRSRGSGARTVPDIQHLKIDNRVCAMLREGPLSMLNRREHGSRINRVRFDRTVRQSHCAGMPRQHRAPLTAGPRPARISSDKSWCKIRASKRPHDPAADLQSVQHTRPD